MKSSNAWHVIRGYLLFFLLLLALRGADLLLTYQITPDLSAEWNPLVTYFNMSWTGFIVMQFLLVLIALLGYHRYAKRVKNPVNKPGLPPLHFVYYYIYGHDLSVRNMASGLIKFSSNHYIRVGSAFIGYVLASGFVLVSTFAIFHNALILGEYKEYLLFVDNHKELYLPFMFTLMVMTSSVVFFTREYTQYKKFSE